MSRCHGSKFLDLDKPWFNKYGRKKAKKFTFMTFPPTIALRNKMLTHSFLPSFNNANDRLCQEEIQKFCYNSNVTSHFSSLHIEYFMESVRGRYLARQRVVESEMKQASAANDRVSLLMQRHGLRKYRTKRFICCIVLIIYIPRHLFVSFLLQTCQIFLKC